MALDFKFPAGFLLDGSDFQLSDAITFHHPSLSEVMCLGKRIYFEEVYWLYVSTLLADSYEHMVWLDDMAMIRTSAANINYDLDDAALAKISALIDDICAASKVLNKEAVGITAE